ncbi:MAG: hypothetical protein PHE99_07035 [Bacteroidales bacterium]|nr:hypothetical protein [Bacteroidales bacterium]MDD4656636.1 hypothetical protein [Bacteroidales bacterium]
MSNTHIEGRTVRIAQPAQVLYSMFVDLTNFTRNLPQEILSEAQVESTPDTITGKFKGFQLGMHITERTPFTQVKYQQYGTSPIPFCFTIKLESISLNTTEFQITMDTELNGMYKMMLGGKLQEAVDKITDQLESTLGVHPAS